MKIRIPEYYKNQEGILSIKHEEETMVWLWAFPELLPWSYKIEWLFSPVVGNKRWPGDLWGLDCEGNLLIIEAKNCRTQRKSNPFEDFLKFHDTQLQEFTEKRLRLVWNGLLKHECSPDYPNCYDERSKNKTKGIVPRSEHREHIRRWKNIAEKIDQRIRNNSYKECIETFLETRKKHGSPIPHFFGLLVMDKDKNYGLNKEGEETMRKLSGIVGESNVHLLVAYAKQTEDETVVLYINPHNV